MPLIAISFAQYLIHDSLQKWRPEDHNALKFVKAIKGETLNGYANVPVRGRNRRLNNSNQAKAAAWFGEMAGDYLVDVVRLNPKALIGLVPLPSSDAVRGTTFTRFPARELATALAEQLAQLGIRNVKVADVLRWTEPMLSARKGGGPREPVLLYPKLTLIGKVAGFNYHLLIDDVLTSGGHLRACAAVLRKNGAEVPFAICAGRTRYVAEDDPFASSKEELPDFVPP